MLGKIEGKRRRGRQRMSWLVPSDHHSMEMNLNKLLEMVKDKGSLACCGPWGHKEPDTTWKLKTTTSVYQTILFRDEHILSL